jgi:HD-like signal output (HDOD) protein/CheY-like chemotaxis protein
MASRTVLIVDADSQSASELSGIIEHFGLKAEVSGDADDAVDKLKGTADVVFLDLRSRAFKGGHVLAKVRKTRPQVPVVICTERGRKGDVVFAMRHGCVDWIDKPAEQTTVANALKRAAREVRRQAASQGASGGGGRAAPAAHRSMIHAIVARIREGSLALPEMPAVIAELREVLQDMTADSNAVLRVLEKDAGLATKIIATANTATFGGRGRVTDLKSAITRLGNRTVASIAQTAALRQQFSFRTPAFKMVFKKMWIGHMVAACIAREIADTIGDDPDEMYLLGLLHNCGEPFLLRVFAEIFQRNSNQVLSMEDTLDVIKEWHGHFGAGLLRKWEMGETFDAVANNHHTEDYNQAAGGDEAVLQRLHIVNAADRVVEGIEQMRIYADSARGPDAAASFDAIGFPQKKREGLLQRAAEIREEIEETF